jgi:choline kinase
VRVEGNHDDEEVLVKIDASGNALRIGKGLPVSEAYGESIGIEVFSQPVAVRMFEILEQRVRAGEGRSEYYEATFQAMIDEGISLKAIDVSKYPAVEIDTPEDLRVAETLFGTARAAVTS